MNDLVPPGVRTCGPQLMASGLGKLVLGTLLVGGLAGPAVSVLVLPFKAPRPIRIESGDPAGADCMLPEYFFNCL